MLANTRRLICVPFLYTIIYRNLLNSGQLEKRINIYLRWRLCVHNLETDIFVTICIGEELLLYMYCICSCYYDSSLQKQVYFEHVCGDGGPIHEWHVRCYPVVGCIRHVDTSFSSSSQQEAEEAGRATYKNILKSDISSEDDMIYNIPKFIYSQIAHGLGSLHLGSCAEPKVLAFLDRVACSIDGAGHCRTSINGGRIHCR